MLAASLISKALSQRRGQNGPMRKISGFTLIELLVVMAIVAILLSIAAPSFKQQIQANTMTSNVNSFLADLRFARSEAIRRGGGVVMCRSDAPEATNASCGSGAGPGGNGWVSGWIVFVDKNNNGDRNYDVDPIVDDTILRVQSPITAMDSIADAGSSTKFVFTATGRLQNTSSATSLQFGGANYANTVQRVVCISLGGRARIAGDGLTSCGTGSL
jgi:type IV fimbrial biogenesis protein FimT